LIASVRRILTDGLLFRLRGTTPKSESMSRTCFQHQGREGRSLRLLRQRARGRRKALAQALALLLLEAAGEEAAEAEEDVALVSLQKRRLRVQALLLLAAEDVEAAEAEQHGLPMRQPRMQALVLLAAEGVEAAEAAEPFVAPRSLRR